MARALEIAFSKKSIDFLKGIESGRRNLVWALEKLCFNITTFDKCAKILAGFAIAENENIGNNSTNQFLQLFHIYLPGTRMSLDGRWKIIEYCLEGSDEYINLGIRAISSALTVGHFHRMGGAEDQGDTDYQMDYQPKTVSEIHGYWTKCLAILIEFAIDSKYQDRSRKIILDHFYGLCVENAGNIIIPIIEKLYKMEFIPKDELRKKIQLALGSNRIYEQFSLSELNRILSSLEPITFKEQFSAWVQSPSPEEYHQRIKSKEPIILLQDKVRNLAESFVFNKALRNDIPMEFVSGHLSEGYNFGKNIGSVLTSEDDAIVIIMSMLKSLKVVSEDKRNFAIISGILMGFNSPSLDKNIFETVLKDPVLSSFTFVIARERSLQLEEMEKLVAGIEQGKFPVSLFSNFNYGWGLKHFSSSEIEFLLKRIRLISDEGKAIVFFILEQWTRKDDESWNALSRLLIEITLNDSQTILTVMKNSMDFFDWSEVCLKILQETKDEKFAELLMNLIIEQSNDIEFYYNKENSFYKILSYLEKFHFKVFWDKISALLSNSIDKGIALFHLKDLLGSKHDYMNTTPGILFGGGNEHFGEILEWAKKVNPEDLHWLANMLPVFNEHPSIANDWHPYARIFINQFGVHKTVLSAISAKLGTYSWTGSVVPKLKSELLLYEKLLDHPILQVREWANAHIQNLNLNIKSEDNRNKDGYFGDLVISGSL